MRTGGGSSSDVISKYPHNVSKIKYEKEIFVWYRKGTP
jgi:hypothetical protein